MDTTELVLTLIGVAINTAIFFLILCEGFYWKPSRAVFFAPLGIIALPIFVAVIGLLVVGEGLSIIGNRGLNLIEKVMRA